MLASSLHPTTTTTGRAALDVTVDDGKAAPTSASVSIDITPVNDAPVTSPVTLAAIAEDSGARLITQAELLANATDVDGPSLTAINLAIASGHGTLVDNPERHLELYAGAQRRHLGDVQLCGDATARGAGGHHASLDITPVNDAPVTSAGDLAAIAEDSGARLITQAELLANATDVDGPSLTAINLAISSGNGTLVDNLERHLELHAGAQRRHLGDVQLCGDRRRRGAGGHHRQPRHHAGERRAGGCKRDCRPGRHTGQRRSHSSLRPTRSTTSIPATR